MTITLRSVQCRNTEDVTGADEFYVRGGVSVPGLPPRAVLTKPFEINDNQKLFFSGALQDPDQAVLFEGNLSDAASIEIGLNFYDADFNLEDWDSRYQSLLAAVGGGIGAALGMVVAGPVGAAAGAMVGATGPALAKAFSTIDKDDLLGTVEQTVKVSDLTEGRHEDTWTFSNNRPSIKIPPVDEPPLVKPKKGSWWSDWDYTVSYVIDVGPGR
ncbi:hypothetical protein [Streptomyces wuyuanensis]|uniref:hypothetical protein n=1 Tax=Streptomyces wuyuanensis TaxID=1196353 RepID=UPI0036C34A37